MTQPMLEEQAHARLTEVLRGWGISRTDAEDTLRWATFGLGLVEMISDDPELPPGVGIVIDEAQDEDLARMFALRERLDDEAFMAQWEVSRTRAARVVLDPRSHQGIFRYSITIERPERIERRFLFLVHVLTPQLAGLQRSGTQLWLIPQPIATTTLGTPISVYEVISHCLPVGTIQEPIAALNKALTHVIRGTENWADAHNVDVVEDAMR
jgi:hypothetical protein